MASGEVQRKKRLSISVRGTVQGVGFRPFVFSCASRLGLSGFVRNDTSGVRIEVEGETEKIEEFMAELRQNPPGLAKIDELTFSEKPPAGYAVFEIVKSTKEGAGFIPVMPDAAMCEKCLAEMMDPHDRRFHYPFINCTCCGPRFSIMKDIPYDRENTSMREFAMCDECRREYESPRDRRFHAQPVACTRCGPAVFFVTGDKKLWNRHDCTKALTAGETGLEGRRKEVMVRQSAEASDREISKAGELLRKGGILAVRGLGGFHLAVNALDDNAVAKLRQRKLRQGKPFAVMTKDVDEVKKYCLINPQEEKILRSQRRPIVLLKKRNDTLGEGISEGVSPGLDTVGVMLPYTPLHHLLMKSVDFPLVMTSGNVSEEPICRENSEAVERLGKIADGFLMHNREIVNRIDDSVCFFAAEKERLIRRARGYAPAPFILKNRSKPLIACGAFYKNTFCLVRDEYAFLSQHIGDLDNDRTFEYYADQVERYRNLFKVNPVFAAKDMHPGYLSGAYADGLGVPVLAVQHHHAHIASVMAEYGAEEVLGIAYDGTGLGTDGRIWGAEFILANYRGFRRVGHLKYVPLPGAEAAVKNPFRSALGHIFPHFEDFREFVGRFEAGLVELIARQIQRRFNCPEASSMGRLFDAASSLIGIRDEASYEGQAAAEMEAAIRPDGGFYEYQVADEGVCFVVDAYPALKAAYCDFTGGIDRGIVAARFHNTVVKFTVDVAKRIRERWGVDRVALAGGCFQNRYLLEKVNQELLNEGFEVLIPSSVPVNDGGLSLGQAVIAAEYFSDKA